MELLQTLRISGGMTETIFPTVEIWLQEDGDHYKSFKYVASRKKLNRYKSVIDFLFCELFTRYRPGCFRYYADKGPPLRKIINDAQREYAERVMLRALQEAYDIFCEQRKISWGWFRTESLKKVPRPETCAPLHG